MQVHSDRSFRELFCLSKKPIIGMVHLTGKSIAEVVSRAVEEVDLYEKCGLDAVLVESHNNDEESLYRGLSEIQRRKFNIPLGVGVSSLYAPYDSFSVAHRFGARFVQIDSVTDSSFDGTIYQGARREYSLPVIGGVRFKDHCVGKSCLDAELGLAMGRCDAIVTAENEIESWATLPKLTAFRQRLHHFPLIAGANVNADNVRSILGIADGIIVGRYFKIGGEIENRVNETNVRIIENRRREVVEELLSLGRSA